MNIGGSNRFHPSAGTQGQRFDPFNHQKMADYWSGLGAPFETFTLGDWTFLEVERRTPWHQAGWSQVHVPISCCYPSPRASGIRRTHRSTNSLHLGIWRCIPWAFHVFSCSSLWRSPFKLKSDLEVERHSGFNMIQQSFRNFWFLDQSQSSHFSLDDSPAQNAWLRAPRCDMDGHGQVCFLRPFFGGIGLNMVDLFWIICNSFCNHFKWFWIVIWIPCLSPQWLWLTMLWLTMFESPIQTR